MGKSRIVETVRRKQAQILVQGNISLLVTIKSIYFEEVRKDEHWIKAMEEELNQIEKNVTCELVQRPKNKHVIDAKWVFRNKLNDSDGKVNRNKEKLVLKGYSHVEGVEFEDFFDQVA